MTVVVPRATSHWLTDGVSLSAAGRRALTPEGDVDNYLKLPLDALVQAGALPDDKLCVRATVDKRWTTRRDAPGCITFAAGSCVACDAPHAYL